jgi:hypothetical protein
MTNKEIMPGLPLLRRGNKGEAALNHPDAAPHYS